jgi:hypothetical protein
MKLNELPYELLINILKFIDIDHLRKLCVVCTLFNKVSSDTVLWKDKLSALSEIKNYSFHPKKIVEGYFTLISKTNDGFFIGYSHAHRDLKDLILKTPTIKNKLSVEAVKEITAINEFFLPNS